MKFLRLLLLLITTSLVFSSCASGYKMIEPTKLNYLSKNINNEVLLEYKYDVLRKKKYKKKEGKKGIKLVALKITNNTDKDLIFGKDITLAYENGNNALIINADKTFSELKQQSAYHLLYLLLTPMKFYSSETESNGVQRQTSSTPIGLVIGPGLAAGNLLVASSANKKFKTELQEYNIINKAIKKGETVYGLIGLQSNSYDAIKIKMTK